MQRFLLAHRRAAAAAAPIAVAALLTGCGGSGAAPAGSGPTTAAGAQTTAPTAATSPTTATAGPTSAPVPDRAEQPCRADDLALSTGPATAYMGNTTQKQLPLVYTNTSATTCTVQGIPGLDLTGPADPNGPTFHVRRVPDEREPVVQVEPGRSATAVLVYGLAGDGAVGSSGSTSWTPQQIVSIPPGGTTPLTADWPTTDALLRDDAATRPATFIQPFRP